MNSSHANSATMHMNFSSMDKLNDKIQRWVETVQASVNNVAIGHTTVPITTLVSSKLRARMENRIKQATSGSIKRIVTLEAVGYFKKKLQENRRIFTKALRRSTQLGAFKKVVDTVEEFCHIAKA